MIYGSATAFFEKRPTPPEFGKSKIGNPESEVIDNLRKQIASKDAVQNQNCSKGA